MPGPAPERGSQPSPTPTRRISAGELAALVGPAAAMDAIVDTLRLFDPENDPPRAVVPLTAGQYLLMPAELGEFAGVKVATVTPGNPAVGLPRIQADYLLHDARTHELLAVLDGTALTTVRTPAVSVGIMREVLRDRFAGGCRVLLYGAGPQAAGHLAALDRVVPVDEVVVAVRDVARHTPAVRALWGERARVVAAATADPAAADVIVAATTSPIPLFEGATVADRAIVIAVGSHEPTVRELDAALLGRATVVVEAVSTALSECGDVILAIGEKSLTAADLVPARDWVRSRPAAAGPVVLKTAGMSWEDLAIAALAYRRAATAPESGAVR